ncbi:MAG: glycoside hydrolase family 127 protein [Armatimonadetes bacterium]|nr:glycoside hydrolase family 127 protein [Armatimonadota bacterium]
MAISAGDSAEMKNDYPIRPVAFTAVKFNDKFWAPRMETNRAVSIPFAFEKCEEHGRMANFQIAGGLIEGEHRGEYPFDETDVYKILEGASYALMVQPDPKLDKYLDNIIAMIAGAQEEDGYLYLPRTNKAEHLRDWFGAERWSNLARSHELYNLGHLYEAAVAHYQATGKRTLLDVALKSADFLCESFGWDKNVSPPGHQVVEMGLAKLYRVTGDEKYIKQAKFFLEARGHARTNDGKPTGEGARLWSEYTQDHKPVLEQDEAVGHAVRAVYMYAGMADVAALTSNPEFTEAIDKLWENVVQKKLYITGGVGACGDGERFGANYELPNMTAYCETCAQIGYVYWNHRQFLLHGEGKYFDILERTLYNGLISGVSMDGKLFFYPNPLSSFGQHARSPWFGCACCPGNVTRFMASIPGYVYAHKDDMLYVNLFVSGEATIAMDSGKVSIAQESNYPWCGKIAITVNPKNSGEFTLAVRVPGWAHNEVVPSDLYSYVEKSDEKYTVTVNGEEVRGCLTKGYVLIKRNWAAGDKVEVDLPMPVRRVIANDLVAEDRGRVAIERGPIVFCAEWPDNKDGNIFNILLNDDAPLAAQWRGDMLNGVKVITGKAMGLSKESKDGPVIREEQEITLIPYYAWAHRGKGQMAVWLARTEDAAKALMPGNATSEAIPNSSNEGEAVMVAMPDDPSGSFDPSAGFFSWWPRKGSAEWLEYTWKEPITVSSVDVYWFDDTGHGECRTPENWKILYKDGNDWKPAENQQGGGITKDMYNHHTFTEVTTDGLRLEVKLQEGFSCGVLRWRVN